MTHASLETPSGKNAGTENFPVGSWMIRADLRTHVHAFYLFARAADDISDNPLLDAADKVARLDAFGAALTGEGPAPIASVEPLRQSLKATGVSAQHSLDLLTAFKRDATQRRYASWDELMDYCRYSASPVGRHILALHGIGEEAWPANDALCSALQVNNHIQDCADDYRELDRAYIPQDLLAAHKGDLSHLSRATLSPELRVVLDIMLDKTEALLVTARAFPRLIPDARLRMEVAVITVMAEKIAKLLRRRDPVAAPVKLGRCGKIRAACLGLLRAWL